MIRLTDNPNKSIWVGNSSDENMEVQTYRTYLIGGLLNVGIDLPCTRGWWNRIEAMHVGLTDGPGNELATYCAAVLALHALTKRHNTLVVCHSGTRALAIAVMYTVAKCGGGWDERLAILQERQDAELPAIHHAHKEAFERIGAERLGYLLEVSDR